MIISDKWVLKLRHESQNENRPVIKSRITQELFCQLGIEDSLSGHPTLSDHPSYLDGYYNGKL